MMIDNEQEIVERILSKIVKDEDNLIHYYVKRFKRELELGLITEDDFEFVFRTNPKTDGFQSRILEGVLGKGKATSFSFYDSKEGEDEEDENEEVEKYLEQFDF